MIIRTYSCANEHEFTTGDTLPECPECGSTKVNWIPSAGHGGILKCLPGNDRIMKDLAGAYGMTNMKSARAGESVMPRSQPPVSAQGPMWSPAGAPGWSMPLDIGPGGAPMASCKPCGVTTPIKPKVDHVLPGARSSAMLPGTTVIARYNGQ